MPYHIVIKKSEEDVLKRLVENWEHPMFAVTEMADTDRQHWHIWVDVDWDEKKMRRELDKHRVNKRKGVSIRKWDINLDYFCKGDKVGEIPNVVHNSIGLTDAQMIEKNETWWFNKANTTDGDPDFKMPSILDELVDACRDEDYHVDDVIAKMIEIMYLRGGKKMCAIRSTGQAYIRTALLYTKNGGMYKKQLFRYYKTDLFG